MGKRLFTMLAVASLALSACGASTATPSPSTEAPTTPPASTAPATSEAPSASAGTLDVSKALFGSNYAPVEGTSGGTLVMGEWQPVDQLNPFFTTAFTELRGTPARTARLHHDQLGREVRPRPGRLDPDR